MFHAKDGFYFERGPDGSVLIHVFASDAVNAEQICEITLGPEIWADVVYQMVPPKKAKKRKV